MVKVRYLSGICSTALLLAGCNDIGESVDTTEKSVAEAHSTSQRVYASDRSDDKAATVFGAESFNIAASESQRAVILEWKEDSHITYTIVRADNSDCEPLTSAGCIGELRIPNMLGNKYYDDTVEQGAVYYYWLISHTDASSGHKSNYGSTTTDANYAETSSTHASSAKRILLPVVDNLDNLIPERSGTFFPQDLRLHQDKDSVVVNWSYYPGFAVQAYASNDADCDLAPAFNNSAASYSQCGVLVGESTNPPLHISTQEAGKNYLWAVIINNSASHGVVSSNSHRVVGPYKLQAKSGANTMEKVSLLERTTKDEHSLSIRLDLSGRYLATNLSYSLVVINSFNPVPFDDIATTLTELRDNNSGATPPARDITARLSSYGHVQARLLGMDEFTQPDYGTLAYRIDNKVTPATWYSVFISADDGVSARTYLPVAIRTANRVHVEVTGKYGLWQIKHGNRVQLALRNSGYFYPGLLDWRTISIDAKVALPARHTYYFSGCPFYANKSDISSVPSLDNNICLFADRDAEGNPVTPFGQPVKVSVTYEHKTTSSACTNFTQVRNDKYQRNRYAKVDNDQALLCDYRKITPGSSEDPNYYVFVNPNNAPAAIAQGKVDMWHAGTQAPVFLKSDTLLPALETGAQPGTVCSSFGPEDGKECDWEASTTIVRCNGFYSYWLPELPGCSMAYALDEDDISAIHRDNLAQLGL